MPLHIHTSPGGGSDIDNALALVREYGKRCKIHIVHMGGGVSGHIKFVPQFFDLIEEGYQVYTDSSWAVGFGSTWLLKEIEERGVGGDRFLFGSDVPWSDYASEVLEDRRRGRLRAAQGRHLLEQRRAPVREVLVTDRHPMSEGFRSTEDRR